jgi:apolipoprotein N-acyltransferase
MQRGKNLNVRQAVNNPHIQSLSGGILMSLAWWEHCTGLIMFIAFVPFLYILYKAKTIQLSGSKVFTSMLPGFLTFNIISFSWLGNVSIAGATMAILAHSFMMSFALWLVYHIYLKASLLTSALSFICMWLAYEYACLNIYLISPWLNLGNVFGKEPSLIQWYEYTGSGGGSLWILLSNLFIFNIILSKLQNDKLRPGSIWTGLAIVIIPIIISIFTGRNPEEDNSPIEVVIIQPNIDPFTEKFEELTFMSQLDEMLGQAATVLDESSSWLILPETAIDDPFFESEAGSNRYINSIHGFLSGYPELNIILGATTKVASIKTDRNGRDNTSEGKEQYILYNSAIHLTQDNEFFYHKSKLVPGFERKVTLPPFLERIIVPELGGSMSGYGIQKEREVFKHFTNGSCAAPVICYESAFGDFTTEYINRGADFIAIITNDGWWKKTAGYKQHLWFASIRAIETRRPVVRSANTGISCVIDKKGEITESLPWWEDGVIKTEIFPGTTFTSYTIYGDLIYRYFTFAGLVILILAKVAAPIRKSRKMQLLK